MRFRSNRNDGASERPKRDQPHSRKSARGAPSLLALALFLLLGTWTDARGSAASILTLQRTIGSVAVFADLHRFYLLSSAEREDQTIELRRLEDGSLVRKIHACNAPRQIAGAPKLGRLYVACTVGSGDDDPTSIVVIDARSGRVRHFSVLSDEAELRVDETSALPFIYASGAHLIRIDARTGRQLAIFGRLGPIVKVGHGRFFTREDAGHSIAVVDARTGTSPARFLVGLARDPSDIDLELSRKRAYIAFRAAAMLGIYNGESGSFARAVATGDHPAAVYADAAHDRVLTVSGGESADRAVLDVFRSDGTHRRSLELDRNGPSLTHESGRTAPIGSRAATPSFALSRAGECAGSSYPPRRASVRRCASVPTARSGSRSRRTAPSAF
jgi:hypothetical protein